MPRGDGTGPWWAQTDIDLLQNPGCGMGGRGFGNRRQSVPCQGLGRRNRQRSAASSTMTDSSYVRSLAKRLARLEEQYERMNSTGGSQPFADNGPEHGFDSSTRNKS